MDKKFDKMSVAALSVRVTLAMDEAPTTVIILRYLDALPGDTAAEPIVWELLEQAAGRLRLLCATFLYKSYPRLTRPPLNLEVRWSLSATRAAAGAKLKGKSSADVKVLDPRIR